MVSSVGGRNLVLDGEKEFHKKDDSARVTIMHSSEGLSEGTYVISFEYEIREDAGVEPPPSMLLHSETTPHTHYIQLPTGDWKGKTSGVFTVKKESENLGLTLYGSLSSVDSVGRYVIFRKIKIEKDLTATPYSPAPEDITENDNHPLIDKINLLLDEPLRSVGDVKDRLFKDGDGLWKVERNVGEITLDGSRRYSTIVNDNPEYSSYYFPDRDIRDIAVMAKITSSHYPFFEHSGSYKQRESQQIRNYSDTSAAIMITDYTMTHAQFQNKLRDSPVIVVYEKRNPTTETLNQDFQDKLSNLRSFKDSNYLYTIVDKTDILSDNLKPTLHAKFLYNNWYKEDRVINNLMIYNRALTNEEMLQNYKTIKCRWGM